MFWQNLRERVRWDACARAQRLLADESVGLLRPQQESWLRHHLESCSVCRAEKQVLTRVLGLLNSLPALSPPSAMWHAVQARICSPTPAGFISVRRWAFAPALATAAALALVASLALRQERIHPLPAPSPDTLAYMQTHALVTSGTPFADRVGLVSYATLAGFQQSQGVPQP